MARRRDGDLRHPRPRRAGQGAHRRRAARERCPARVRVRGQLRLRRPLRLHRLGNESGFSRIANEGGEREAMTIPSTSQGACMSAAAPRTYPLRLDGEIDEKLSRGLWLVKWLVAIAHFIVLDVLWFVFIILERSFL